MARACRIVVVALLMFAVIGLASATAPSGAPAADEDYEGDDYTIGALASGAAMSPNSIVAAPLGGPVPPGAFDNAKGGDDSTPSSAASSIGHSSAVAGVASAALAAAFYF